MADKKNRYEDNCPGMYYVDKECIDCSLCAEIAPDNFRHSEEMDHDICFKQPETDKERELCEEALECCPVEAIGNDGEESENPEASKSFDPHKKDK